MSSCSLSPSVLLDVSFFLSSRILNFVKHLIIFKSYSFSFVLFLTVLNLARPTLPILLPLPLYSPSPSTLFLQSSIPPLLTLAAFILLSQPPSSSILLFIFSLFFSATHHSSLLFSPSLSSHHLLFASLLLLLCPFPSIQLYPSLSISSSLYYPSAPSRSSLVLLLIPIPHSFPFYITPLHPFLPILHSFPLYITPSFSPCSPLLPIPSFFPPRRD